MNSHSICGVRYVPLPRISVSVPYRAPQGCRWRIIGTNRFSVGAAVGAAIPVSLVQSREVPAVLPGIPDAGHSIQLSRFLVYAENLT